MYNVTWRLSCNHCCRGKTLSIKYSKSVFVAVGIQHALHIVMLSSAACLTLQYFFTLSQKWVYFQKKKVTEHKMCVMILYTTFV